MEFITYIFSKVTWFLILGLALGSFLLVRWKFRALKGFVGEWRIRRLVAKLGDQYSMYHNVYVRRSDGKLTQVDHVIVSRYQVFVLETKNYAGTIYGEESDTYWTQAFGKKERLFYSPILQNEGHVKALLHQVGGASEVQSIVVFSDQTRLRVNPYMESKVLSNRDLLAYIGRFKRKVLTAAEVERWNTVLKSLQKSKRHGRFRMWQEHLRFVRGVQKRYRGKEHKPLVEKYTHVEGKSTHCCPKCGKELILRNGKYGEFYGCSGFPDCRYSVNVWQV